MRKEQNKEGWRMRKTGTEDEWIFEALSLAGQRWSSPREKGYQGMIKGISKAQGWSIQMTRLAVAETAQGMTADALRIRKKILQENGWSRRRRFVWLSGNLPPVSIQAFVDGMLLGGKWTARTSCRDGNSLCRFSRFFKMAAEGKKISFSIFSLERKKGLKKSTHLSPQIDELLIFGGEESFSEVRRACASVPYRRYGPRISLGVIDEKDLEEEKSPKFVLGCAKDVLRFEQQGCLSPRVFALITSKRELVERWAFRLYQSMRGFRCRYPCVKSRARAFDPDSLSGKEAGLIRNLRDELIWSGKGGYYGTDIFSEGTSAWTVVPPLHFPSQGFIWSVQFKKIEDFITWAKRLKTKVSCVGYSPSLWALGDKKFKEILKLKPYRVCPLGTMQLPSWSVPHELPLLENG